MGSGEKSSTNQFKSLDIKNIMFKSFLPSFLKNIIATKRFCILFKTMSLDSHQIQFMRHGLSDVLIFGILEVYN